MDFARLAMAAILAYSPSRWMNQHGMTCSLVAELMPGDGTQLPRPPRLVPTASKRWTSIQKEMVRPATVERWTLGAITTAPRFSHGKSRTASLQQILVTMAVN